MPWIDSSGLRIRWEQWGEGDPVVLVHGFSETLESIWERGGWIRDLIAAGRRAVALDLRGHGGSDRPHDPAAYTAECFADDLAGVVDHAAVDRAHFVGFSLGGETVLRYLMRHGTARARSAVVVSLGRAFLRPRARSTALSVEALRAGPDAEMHPMLRKFRQRAERKGADLKALAALLETERPPPSTAELGAIDVPVLFVSGAAEAMVGDAAPIAEHVPGSRVLRIEGADHDGAVMSDETRTAALAFMDAVDGR